MALPAYPLINGHRYSFASIECVFNGIPIVGFRSINYSDNLEPGEVRGSSPFLLGRTRGKYSATCSFEMYKLEFEALRLTLGRGGIGFKETPFDIVCSYAELGQPVMADIIIGGRLTNTGNDNAEGTDSTIIRADLSVMHILWNGQPAVTPTAPIGI